MIFKGHHDTDTTDFKIFILRDKYKSITKDNVKGGITIDVDEYKEKYKKSNIIVLKFIAIINSFIIFNRRYITKLVDVSKVVEPVELPHEIAPPDDKTEEGPHPNPRMFTASTFTTIYNGKK